LKRKFDNADDSGDGQISVDEFSDHFKDFFGKKGDATPAPATDVVGSPRSLFVIDLRSSLSDPV
jgi:hypothetical protein